MPAAAQTILNRQLLIIVVVGENGGVDDNGDVDGEMVTMMMVTLVFMFGCHGCHYPLRNPNFGSLNPRSQRGATRGNGQNDVDAWFSVQFRGLG